MVAIVSRCVSHITDIFHVGRSFATSVHVLLIISPHGSFCPFLSSGWLAVYASLSVIEIINHVVVVIFPAKFNVQDYFSCTGR